MNPKQLRHFRDSQGHRFEFGVHRKGLLLHATLETVMQKVENPKLVKSSLEQVYAQVQKILNAVEKIERNVTPDPDLDRHLESFRELASGMVKEVEPLEAFRDGRRAFRSLNLALHYYWFVKHSMETQWGTEELTMLHDQFRRAFRLFHSPDFLGGPKNLAVRSGDSYKELQFYTEDCVPVLSLVPEGFVADFSKIRENLRVEIKSHPQFDRGRRDDLETYVDQSIDGVLAALEERWREVVGVSASSKLV